MVRGTVAQDAFLDKHGVKLGFMSAFVKAAADALQVFNLLVSMLGSDRAMMCHCNPTSYPLRSSSALDPLNNIARVFESTFRQGHDRCPARDLQAVPAVNGVIDGTDLIYRDYYDISIAVATPKGLVVPVLRNVEDLDFAGVERVSAPSYRQCAPACVCEAG